MNKPETSPLTERPGFLVRRLHQIHQALFAEECAAFDITPVQFSIMSVAAIYPGLDQTTLAHEVGVDRTTLANVVARLEKRKLLRRTRSKENHRLKCVHLTVVGQHTVAQMDNAVTRAHQRTIAALAPAERHAFMAALKCLVDSGNEYGRAPLRLG
ncbi:MarR family winged helix-turn-helix transcriptional regulator [Acidocella sp.]|uniref:MarR family winged helix-turn-helix transcriptional regulator n=1 Tax=Acidocella sp. TaxID=50710 RepID=UPI003CFF053C